MAYVMTGVFNGINGQGAVAVPGLKAGDRVIRVVQATGHPADSFAPFVLADDELMQIIGNNHTGDSLVALLERQVVISV
jgi:hypothetical protein